MGDSTLKKLHPQLSRLSTENSTSSLSPNSSMDDASSSSSYSCVYLPSPMYSKGPLLGSSELIKNLPRKEAVLQITVYF